ncbi:MAG TPA: hypothetical protein VE978_10220 [Chitinophagales bacterium]|nr:hypothetical protein [Chitinophagales bacterium]
MARRISAYILFGLGILTVTFFREYSGKSIPYPFLFWFLGFVMFLAGWAVLRFTPTVKDVRDTKRLKKLIEDLRANGEKIKVDFSKCEIKSNDYSEERERYGTGNPLTTLSIEAEIQAWNALTDQMRNTKIVEVYQSVLVFKFNNNGKTETFISRVIPKDRATLMFKLGDKKETTLYVDKIDRSRYYFDLEFLWE